MRYNREDVGILTASKIVWLWPGAVIFRNSCVYDTDGANSDELQFN